VALAERARKRILAEHTAAHRAEQLECYAFELLSGGTRPPPRVVLASSPPTVRAMAMSADSEAAP
jgi:hypothetical protein